MQRERESDPGKLHALAVSEISIAGLAIRLKQIESVESNGVILRPITYSTQGARHGLCKISSVQFVPIDSGSEHLCSSERFRTRTFESTITTDPSLSKRPRSRLVVCI